MVGDPLKMLIDAKKAHRLIRSEFSLAVAAVSKITFSSLEDI
jgi:hypothetical protein